MAQAKLRSKRLEANHPASSSVIAKPSKYDASTRARVD